MGDTRQSIKVDDYSHQLLKIISSYQKRNMQDILQELIRDYFKTTGFAAPPEPETDQLNIDEK